ncbi:heterokaryon incompatibility protein-domain-containing protein, partial [Usnea florida]
MRLLNTESHTFQGFFDNSIPEYAILSHRWGDEEISFQQFWKGRNQDSEGYAKVKRCCSLAQYRGVTWVWVDTCCIDKKSSAELSEAINSMYRWYQNAKECYVYLSDVAWNPEDIGSSEALFTRSLWFTRGWTLQELLAPSDVTFFDSAWNELGTKNTLATLISAATGIDIYHIENPLEASIAQKMRWISRRKTSRLEDMAYCMLGLFDVNLPLLYGEGAKAFMRLQLEVIQQSDDDSIFAW